MRKLLLLLLFFTFAAQAQEKIAIQKVLDEAVYHYQLTGAAVTIRDIARNQSWNFASGLAERDTALPLKDSQLFQAGSITKSFIAALVLTLESNKFNIEQPLGKWFPEYKSWKNIKIRQLLNMTGGLYNYTEDETLFDDLAQEPQGYLSAKTLVDRAYAHQPNTNFRPGKSYEYSNTGYILAGLLIEKLTGKSLERVIKERIFDKYPDKFRHIFYEPKIYPQGYLPEMAHGYSLHPTRHTQFYQQDITSISLSWAGSAGAIIARTEDLANWAELLFSKKLLNSKQQTKLQSLICDDEDCKKGSPLSSNSKFSGYGLGVGAVYDPDYGKVWTHSGGTLGYQTIFIYIPDLALSLSVAINQMAPELDDEPVMLHIADVVLKEYLKGV